MSFDQGRDTLDRVDSNPIPNSASHTDNELPLPPKPEADGPSSPLDSEARERVSSVLQSDIGISTLLNRLKQSVSSARDLAAFLKERSSLEEKHAQSLRRLSRGTHEVIRRPESRGGSFASNFEEMTKIHDRMADNGLQFATALHQMHDELQELTSKSERDRKHWKQTGLDAEKRVQDAENAMNKAKGKYNSLADSYDRARTGERQLGKFGIIGTKSAEKQEEDLHRKLEAADGDYASKVQAAQTSRQDLVTTHRPQAIRALEEAIKECDAGLSLQLSKYAALTEKMLLGNGLCVSPLRSQAAGASKSLREIAQSVDNQRDFHDYIVSFSAKAGTRQPEIKYEKHPTLSPQQQRPTQPYAQGFETAQPPYGAPERTNTYDSFQQGHRPSQSGQISGVLPYQPPSGGPMSPGQDTQFQSGLPGSPYKTSHPPQLPRIGSFGTGPGMSSDLDTPVKSPMDSRGGPQGQRPDNSSSTGQTAGYGPGSTPSVTIGGYGPAPTPSAAGGYGPGPTPSKTVGSYSDGPTPSNVNVGQVPGPTNSHPTSGFGSGPTSSTNPGDFGGSPTFSQPGANHSAMQAQTGPKTGFHPDGRGPSISTLGSGPAGSRGPSFGQPNDVPADIRSSQAINVRSEGPSAPAYSQTPYQPDPRGPGASQNGNYPGPPGPTGAAALPSNQKRNDTSRQNLPPTRPVFGVSLDELFRRDETAVPRIVYQCVQAVDLFGLNTEGIYRTSGSAPYIMELKAVFDNDASKIDFRNPAAFHHDIASVTTLLKHFLRDLPDALLTSAAYSQFIAAARIDDDHVRRDSLHAIINALPDPNYATLRVLALHLQRVAQHSDQNRMTTTNLAIVLGPTIMGAGGNGGNGGGGLTGNPAADVKDAGFQARCVETILNNTLQIFDDDDE